MPQDQHRCAQNVLVRVVQLGNSTVGLVETDVGPQVVVTNAYFDEQKNFQREWEHDESVQDDGRWTSATTQRVATS